MRFSLIDKVFRFAREARGLGPYAFGCKEEELPIRDGFSAAVFFERGFFPRAVPGGTSSSTALRLAPRPTGCRIARRRHYPCLWAFFDQLLAALPGGRSFAHHSTAAPSGKASRWMVAGLRQGHGHPVGLAEWMPRSRSAWGGRVAMPSSGQSVIQFACEVSAGAMREVCLHATCRKRSIFASRSAVSGGAFVAQGRGVFSA